MPYIFGWRIRYKNGYRNVIRLFDKCASMAPRMCMASCAHRIQHCCCCIFWALRLRNVQIQYLDVKKLQRYYALLGTNQCVHFFGRCRHCHATHTHTHERVLIIERRKEREWKRERVREKEINRKREKERKRKEEREKKKERKRKRKKRRKRKPYRE